METLSTEQLRKRLDGIAIEHAKLMAQVNRGDIIQTNVQSRYLG